MKKILYLFIFVVSSLHIHAQEVLSSDKCEDYISKAYYRDVINCLREKPNNRDNKERLIYCYKKTQNYTELISLLKELIDENQSKDYLITDLAEVYEANGEFENSLSCYKKLEKKDTSNIYFKFKEAGLLFNLENYLESIALYKKVYAQSNETLPCLSKIADGYKMSQEKDSAIFYYNKAYQINPSDWKIALNLMGTYINNNLYQEAADLGEDYQTKDSTNKKINLLHSFSLYKLKKYQVAVDGFEKCLARGDSSLIVNRSLGLSYFNLGQDSLAYQYLSAAYLQDSTNNNVLYQLATTSQDLTYKNQAIEYFNKLVERTLPQTALLYYYYKALANIYFTDQDFHRSLDYNLLVLKYANDNQKTDQYFQLADLYHYYLDDDKEANKYYMKYVDSLKLYLQKNQNEISEEDKQKVMELIKRYETRNLEITEK